uniref:Serine/threonine-protein phosphatase 1 regulatory subunit 10 n=1 Tax=Anthurium amnicola TaxID=1678845 RepID=A0A1D1ZKI9_9ARAE
MTLEDFFTLSEMKDGLASVNRVEELLSVMQNQKDCVSNIANDAARQWTTVTSILAATENNDCLDHFIQLNGLSFLNRWLQEALKWSDDNSDSSMEELISALLQALDKLPVEKDKLSASGIAVTVKQLCVYRSHVILEKAETLCNKWNDVGDIDSKCEIVDENAPSLNDGLKVSTKKIKAEEGVLSANSVLEVSPSHVVCDEHALSCSNSSPADTAKDVKVPSDQISPHSILTSSDRNVISEEMNTVGSLLMSSPCQESLSIKEESDSPAVGVASTGTCSSPASRGRIVDEPSDVSDRKYASDGAEDMDIEVNVREGSPCKSSEKEMHTISAETSFHMTDDIGMAIECKEAENEPNLKVDDKGMESKISCALKPTVDANTVNEMDRRRSEIGLEYGEIDALEVARQVAIEVEREVVDYREPFCSSPEAVSRGEIMDSCSSELAENKNEKPASEQLSENESPSRKDLSVDSSLRNSTRTSEDADVKDSSQHPESPKSNSVLGSVGNTNKNKCDFDLNEDFFSEETDSQMVPAANQTNLSAPIPVAAAKGAPSLPVTPLHFEGELGWKGSAATSAFRPASPRRTSDIEKNVFGPKQKVNFLKIDLNVAEEDDGVVDPLFDKHAPPSSNIPSEKSSMEMCSVRAERMKLDLNCIGDEDTLPNQSSYWRPQHRNGNCSPSPASSSSSRQPSMRDFDLNDNPFLFDVSGSNSLGKSSSKETSTYGSYKLDDPCITIMGSKMSVERKELVNQTQRSFVGNGLGVDSAFSARASAAYPPMPPHAYGYHGLQMAIPPTFYGPGSFPYMVDSRGATVIPQILGSAGLSGATSARPPFFMSVAGAPPGLNMVGVPRPGLDLNSGTAPAEGGSREIGSYKQLFMQGSSGLVDDHLTSTSQPAGSGVVLKRKEPDCGWEPYTFGYKQATSWQ